MTVDLVSLGEICKEIYRYPTYYGIEYLNNGVPEVRGELITEDGTIDLDRQKWRFISETTSSKFPRTNLEEGDLIMSVRGTIGKVGIVPHELHGANITANLIRISPNKQRVYERYLWMYMRSPEFLNSLDNESSSTTIKTIKAPNLKALRIPLPLLEEQKRIADILDRAEALRAKRRIVLAQLDEFTQSLFIEIFGNPIKNSKNWETLKFSEVGTLQRGKSKHRPRNAPELLGGKYPLIQTGDVANSGGYITEYTQTYSELGLKQSKMWPAGTLCITIAANIAKTGILTFDACFPDSVVGFIPNEKVKIEYVQYWMSFLQKMLEESAPESAQKNINLKILFDLNIPVPPLELQNKFTLIVHLVEKVKQSHQQSLLELNNLFDSLSHEAFTGKLFSHQVFEQEIENGVKI